MSKFTGKSLSFYVNTRASERSGHHTASTRTAILLLAAIGVLILYASTNLLASKRYTPYSFAAGASELLEQNLPIDGSWKTYHSSFGLEGYADSINVPLDYSGSSAVSSSVDQTEGSARIAAYSDLNHDLSTRHPHLSFFFKNKNPVKPHVHLPNHHQTAAAAMPLLHFAKGAHNRRSLSSAQVAASFRASASKESTSARHLRYRDSSRAKVALRYTRDRDGARRRILL